MIYGYDTWDFNNKNNLQTVISSNTAEHVCVKVIRDGTNVVAFNSSSLLI